MKSSGKASPAKAAEGDEPVFAYIASLPQPQRGVAGSLTPGSSPSICRARCRGRRPGSRQPAWISQAAAPRGASTTIGEYLRAGSTAATIVGTIVGLAGTAEGSRVTVDDGTGRLVVWCAAATDPHFVVRIRNVVELDLLSPPGNGAGGSEAAIARIQAEIQGAVIRGDMAAAQDAALPLAGFIAPGSSDAVALAVRPGGAKDGPDGASQRADRP